MNNIIKNFLNKSSNKNLYKQFILTGHRESLDKLNQRFEAYIFKIKFCSYIDKSLSLYSRKLHNKQLKNSSRELLTLNIAEEGFNEERINMIADTSINYIEEIEKPKEEVNFNNIISDKKIINALDKLTDKQREIIYCSIILENTEKGLSRKLGISQQAVNKSKNKGLNKLRNYIKEVS